MIARLRREDGFSLTEMLVAAALFALVVFVAGGIFIGQAAAQRQVSAVTSATTDAQSAGNAIDGGIRNSTGFKLRTVGTDQFLVARVAGTGATLQWECRAWYYSSSAGTIRSTTATPGTPMSPPTATALESWILLVDGVTPRTGSTIFSDSGATLTVAFNAVTGEGAQPVAISFSTSPLAGVTENSTCY